MYNRSIVVEALGEEYSEKLSDKRQNIAAVIQKALAVE